LPVAASIVLSIAVAVICDILSTEVSSTGAVISAFLQVIGVSCCSVVTIVSIAVVAVAGAGAALGHTPLVRQPHLVAAARPAPLAAPPAAALF
jgi:hypothetical protein